MNNRTTLRSTSVSSRSLLGTCFAIGLVVLFTTTVLFASSTPQGAFDKTLAVNGPVNLEVVSTDAPGMVKEARDLASLHKNVVVKIPLIAEGLKAVKELSKEGIRTNVTLCFSPTQALLAAKAGATYISPFVGRLDDISHVGMELVRQIVTIYKIYNFSTQVLAASLRTPIHFLDAAMAGAHVCTLPPSVLRQLIKHPLTDIGLAGFLADWKKVPKGA